MELALDGKNRVLRRRYSAAHSCGTLLISHFVAWRTECLPVADLERGSAELQVMQLAVAAAQAQRRGLFAIYGAESLLLLSSLHLQRPVVGLEFAQTQLSSLLASDEPRRLPRWEQRWPSCSARRWLKRWIAWLVPGPAATGQRWKPVAIGATACTPPPSVRFFRG